MVGEEDQEPTTRPLAWGETPWDALSRDDLLREVQRMYSALVSANSVLHLARAGNETSGFWGPRGTGGEAVAKARQVLAPLREEYGDEGIYRAFFRYADDLLFDTTGDGAGIGTGWRICPVCGRMFGNSMGDKLAERLCSEVLPTGCEGELEPLQWRHLERKHRP
jgi:hypothetical protein